MCGSSASPRCRYRALTDGHRSTLRIRATWRASWIRTSSRPVALRIRRHGFWVFATARPRLSPTITCAGAASRSASPERESSPWREGALPRRVRSRRPSRHCDRSRICEPVPELSGSLAACLEGGAAAGGAEQEQQSLDHDVFGEPARSRFTRAMRSTRRSVPLRRLCWLSAVDSANLVFSRTAGHRIARATRPIGGGDRLGR